MSTGMPTCSSLPAFISGDAVGDRHRLFLVVRDIERGDAERLLQLADFAAHADPQTRIEIAERLVEQQHLRADHQGAGDGDALQLAARQLVRPALAVARAAGPAPSASSTRVAISAAGTWRALQAIGDVAGDGEVGKHRIVLEHHADVAQMRPAAGRCAASPKRISPSSSSQKPAIMRSSVVLPQPDGPSSVKNSPSPTSRST